VTGQVLVVHFGFAVAVRGGIGLAAEQAPERRRAVIIGNSDGIGYALTRRLLDDGWRIAGLSRSASDLRHDRYRHTVVDVTTTEYPRLLDAAVDALGGVDLCVYAAGIGEFFDVMDLSTQTRTLEVNLIGAARTVETVVPRMLAASAGHIIGVSSLADATASGQAPGYSASKAGLSNYLRGLALALRQHGLSVTTVRIGFVDTKMAKADRKPAMMSVNQAVDLLVDTIATRPAVVSRPRRMALAMRLLDVATAAQLRQRPSRR
jgi:NAD(P)-dependent dehydrogenase (short-subunit alcohol dehydrogenase family)